MFTNYYYVKGPWTSIRAEKNSFHWKIELWEKGGFSGELTVLANSGADAIFSFADTSTCPLYVFFYKKDACGKLKISDNNLCSSATVISSNGEIFKVQNLLDKYSYSLKENVSK